MIDEARARGLRAIPQQESGEREARADPADPIDGVMDAWLVEEGLRRIGPEHRVVLAAGLPLTEAGVVGVTELAGGLDVLQASLPG